MKKNKKRLWDFTASKSPDFSQLEERVLDFWKEQKIFSKVLGKNTDRPYTFYDGPPFANGLPHYGHLATGYAKDIIPRYQTMRGHCVPRRFGWDCHGLPAELETEASLGVSGRQDILAKGIDVFNDHCRRSVLRYTKDWEAYVERQGRWVDFKGAYKTMDCSYMEKILKAFKTLYEKGLIYQGYRVVPYSWKVQTALSHFETRLDQSYRKRQDPAIVVAFELEGTQESLWVWTTTPWTLPSNLALALKADIPYVTVKDQSPSAGNLTRRGNLARRGILAESALPRFNKDNRLEVVGRCMGKELIGKKYRPLFPFFQKHKNAFKVLDGDFVQEEEGTGIVHLAPAFGEDDMACCQKHDIAIVMPVDEAGCFTEEVPPFQGMQVFEANKPIIRFLKEQNFLIQNATIDHSYPHCWRTDTPLIYKAVNSWYLKVSAFRERMCQLNQEITWVPSHIKEGLFGKWLENARDWNISRSRFWGTPLPVWISSDPTYPRTDVYGSLQELERDFGVALEDLHRPGIDLLTRSNPDDPTGKSIMKRVEDVFDCWFESGAMPFASLEHALGGDKTALEKPIPADFIVEYTAQTRGWFYTLMVLSTALFDQPPFKHCLCHGVVLDGKKQKLSKRLKNYADPQDVFQNYGSDTLRWRMASSPLFSGGNLCLDQNGKDLKDVQKQILRPLWSACHFYSIYASSENITPRFITDSTLLMSTYLLWQVGELEGAVRKHLDAYAIPEACASVERFLDVLNNWYIRRQRETFWQSGDSATKQDVFDTLYTALKVLSKIVAPLLPFLAEAIHVSLMKEGDMESVHLEPWPNVSKFPWQENPPADYPEKKDFLLVESARCFCSEILKMRKKAKIRIRQPLAKVEMYFFGEDFKVDIETATLNLGMDREIHNHIREEINVKKAELISETISVIEHGWMREKGTHNKNFDDEVGKYFYRKIWLNPRLRHKHPDWAKRADDGDDTLFKEGIASDDLQDRWIAKTHSDPDIMTGVYGDWGIVLHIKIDDVLRIEGDRNDLNRHLQVERKKRKFHVLDKVSVRVTCSDPTRLEDVLGNNEHKAWLEKSVRITDWNASSEEQTQGMMGDVSIEISMNLEEPFVAKKDEES